MAGQTLIRAIRLDELIDCLRQIASGRSQRPDRRGPTVPQMYRVRYSLKPSGKHHRSTDVETADVEGDLEGIPDRLPAGAYIMYVEDLTAGRDVHWTRWPKSYRPGFGS